MLRQDTYARVVLEFLYATLAVNARPPNLEMSESPRKYLKKVFVLGEYNRLCTGVMFPDPKNMPGQRIDFRTERPVHINVLDLG